MSAPQSRVIPDPIRVTYIGVVVAAALWVVLGVIWFSRPVADFMTMRRFIGEFIGLSGIYLLAIGNYLAIDWSASDRRWGGSHKRTTIRKTTTSVAFLMVCIAPIVMTHPGVHSGIPGAVMGWIALVMMALTLLFSWSKEIGKYFPEAEKTVPFPFTWLLHPPFDLWRVFHDLMGVYIILIMVSGFMESEVMRMAPEMYWIYLVICLFSVICWVWATIVQRFIYRGTTMLLTGVRQLAPKSVELTMEPIGDKPMPVVRPGQFVKVSVPGVLNGPHSFIEVSAPGRDVLQVAFKVVGGDTRVLRETVGVGMEVQVRGPYGDLDMREATPQQVWIAAGVGITPFISWLRAIDALIDEKIRRSGVASRQIRKVATAEALEQLGIERVDLWFFHHGEPTYMQELYYWEKRYPWLEVHVRDTKKVGRFTAKEIMESTPGIDPFDLEGVSAVLCGPWEMVMHYRRELRRMGVEKILREDFSFR